MERSDPVARFLREKNKGVGGKEKESIFCWQKMKTCPRSRREGRGLFKKRLTTVDKGTKRATTRAPKRVLVLPGKGMQWRKTEKPEGERLSIACILQEERNCHNYGMEYKKEIGLPIMGGKRRRKEDRETTGDNCLPEGGKNSPRSSRSEEERGGASTQNPQSKGLRDFFTKKGSTKVLRCFRTPGGGGIPICAMRARSKGGEDRVFCSLRRSYTRKHQEKDRSMLLLKGRRWGSFPRSRKRESRAN